MIKTRRTISCEDLDNITKVLARFISAFPEYAPMRAKLYSVFLSVHQHVPMDLKAMAEWDRFTDIAHDIGGMLGRWDPETHTFRDCFWPRFALQQ